LGSALSFAAPALAADAPSSTAEVLKKVHEADQQEIQAGKMAEKKGQTQQVKDYGKMLVKDHTAADKKVTALAKHEDIDLGKKTAPGEDAMNEMAEMKAMTGPNFDSLFARQMLEDHRKTIAELTQVRDTTSDPQLKKLLSDLIPTLQKHEDEAQKIVDSAGGSQ
jgi:putative membrane protein